MTKSKFELAIDHKSDVLKCQQFVNALIHAIGKITQNIGDALSSVNSICKTNQLSRYTIFKTNSLLKKNGEVESVSNKGCFVANKIRKVLLVLDTFKAYKEVLYHSFTNNLPDIVIKDVQNHQYNIDDFETIEFYRTLKFKEFGSFAFIVIPLKIFIKHKIYIDCFIFYKVNQYLTIISQKKIRVCTI